MFGQASLTYFLVGLLLTYTVGAPVEETKEKKQLLAVPIVVGLEELLAGGLLAGTGAALSSLLSQGHSGGSDPDPDSHACSGYSSKYGRTTGGWCKPGCGSHEISVPNGSCGSNVCCIPNN